MENYANEICGRLRFGADIMRKQIYTIQLRSASSCRTVCQESKKEEQFAFRTFGGKKRSALRESRRAPKSVKSGFHCARAMQNIRSTPSGGSAPK